MKKFLWITIGASVIGGLIFLSGVFSVNGAPQPVGSPPAAGKAKCECSNLKVLQIELRNALRLQQNFRNKIPELRTINVSTSKAALQVFAAGDARNGLESVPNYDGPQEFDYVSWGDTQDPDHISKYTNEKLCGFDNSASQKLEEAKQASACAGIGAALEAHENWHVNFCLSIGYRPYLTMHGADRAKEEVEAYGAQIAVLRAEIARLLKECQRYKATGQDGPVVYSGTICSLEKPFTVTGTHPLVNYPLKFVPSSATTGTFSYSVNRGMMSMGGSGTYTVEGLDTDKPQIVCKVDSTASVAMASSSGSGIAHIQLVPLDTDECKEP
jgi:hypothetical protein